MLFVFNKEKICAYFVSILTVVILFCITISSTSSTPDNTVSTSTNTYTNNTINTINVVYNS